MYGTSLYLNMSNFKIPGSHNYFLLRAAAIITPCLDFSCSVIAAHFAFAVIEARFERSSGEIEAQYAFFASDFVSSLMF